MWREKARSPATKSDLQRSRDICIARARRFAGYRCPIPRRSSANRTLARAQHATRSQGSGAPGQGAQEQAHKQGHHAPQAQAAEQAGGKACKQPTKEQLVEQRRFALALAFKVAFPALAFPLEQRVRSKL